ncbi:hypothetical protein HOP50_08g51860 [Chloropicon primus]|uniref:Uncharacterized protein n=1 Tax=Chloropicon primus TaxID=1764295 RepID=A0A5B8MQ43_9CHLO|nr:hypothetical protein A3770_08p51570 [Chloropicon primus]UPR01862.1 hypothetical protein HOP50_08g51860 [Chloropicon primus]|eukprot:QDZ22639.1 hypothetical protein A3770_08p51570 [Chloropicon primus]
MRKKLERKMKMLESGTVQTKFRQDVRAAMQGHGGSGLVSGTAYDPSPGMVPPTDFSSLVTSTPSMNNNSLPKDAVTMGMEMEEEEEEEEEEGMTRKGDEMRRALVRLASSSGSALNELSNKVFEFEQEVVGLRVKLVEREREQRAWREARVRLEAKAGGVETLTQENHELKKERGKSESLHRERVMKLEAEVAEKEEEVLALRRQKENLRKEAVHFSDKFLESRKSEEEIQQRYNDLSKSTDVVTSQQERENNRLRRELDSLRVKYDRVKKKAREYKERCTRAQGGLAAEDAGGETGAEEGGREPEAQGVAARETDAKLVVKAEEAKPEARREVLDDLDDLDLDVEVGPSQTESDNAGGSSSRVLSCFTSPRRRQSRLGGDGKEAEGPKKEADSPGWIPRKRSRADQGLGSKPGGSSLKQRKIFSEGIDEFFVSQLRSRRTSGPLELKRPSSQQTEEASEDCCVVVDEKKKAKAKVDLSKYDKYRNENDENGGTPRDYWHIGVTPPSQSSQ